MKLDHFILWMSSGVGGAFCMNIVEICRVLAIAFICCVCSSNLIGIFLWCMQSMWMA